MSGDLKPYGRKLQTWLFPWDAYLEVRDCGLAFAGVTDRETADEVLAALALFQRGTFAPANLTAYMFAALDRYAPADVDARAWSIGQVTRVFEHGAAKYSPDNWRNIAATVDSEREYFSAQARHVLEDLGRVRLDPDSGVEHLAHACCGGLMMTWRRLHQDVASAKTRSPFFGGT